MEIIDVGKVAEILGVKRSHVYALARSGDIPCFKVGGAVRFDFEKIKAWVDNGGTAQESRR